MTAPEFLPAALALIDGYWSAVSPKAALGSLDALPPIAVRPFLPDAETWVRAMADAVLGARHPTTGLVMFPQSAALPHALIRSTAGLQRLDLIGRLTGLLDWFLEDPPVVAGLAAIADATMKHFDFIGPTGKPEGVWGWADVASGRGEGLVTAVDLGLMAVGMVRISAATGDPKPWTWALSKLRWAWDARPNPRLSLFADRYCPVGAVVSDGGTIDTDSLYLVRRLFEVSRITGDTWCLHTAVDAADRWGTLGWFPTSKHFTRKLRLDSGKPATHDLYGDGKYNTLFVLVELARATKNKVHIDRLRTTWLRLLSLGGGEFVPAHVRQGKAVADRGLDSQQSMFLDILLDAYEVDPSGWWLAQAEGLARRLLARPDGGKNLMREQSGQAGTALLRLALARGESMG